PEGDRPLVARALAKDPRQRFSSCMDFVRALIAQDASEVPATETSATHARAATIHDLCLVEKARTASTPPIARPTPAFPRPGTGSQATKGEKPSAPCIRVPSSSPDTPSSAEGPLLCIDDFHFLDCLGRSPLGEMWKVETPDGAVRLVKLVNTFSQSGLFGEDDPIERLGAIRHPGLLARAGAPHPPNLLAVGPPLAAGALGS